MRCPHCHQEHPENYEFCPITGGKLDKEVSYHYDSQEEQPKLSPDRIPITTIILPRLNQDFSTIFLVPSN